MPIPKRKYHKRGEMVNGYLCRDHPLYHTWYNMLVRCFNENDAHYHNYGGRGISVCGRWLYFKNFVNDMGSKPNEYLTLERKDNNGNYEPANCEWATRSKQCSNRRVFRNNKSGCSGIVRNRFRGFSARFDYEGVRYTIGHYDNLELARKAREAFSKVFFLNKHEALSSLHIQTVWRNSKTGIRGITPHKDGGYVARLTIDSKRIYLGYFKTIGEAVRERDKQIKKRT